MSSRIQTWFNTAVAGLAAQGFERSMRIGTVGCSFRSPNGRKCAIGHLISDEEYNKQVEILRASGVVNNEPNPMVIRCVVGGWNSEALALESDLSATALEERYFLGDLMVAHDISVTPEAMRVNLQKLGSAMNLVIPEVLR